MIFREHMRISQLISSVRISFLPIKTPKQNLTTTVSLTWPFSSFLITVMTAKAMNCVFLRSVLSI